MKGNLAQTLKQLWKKAVAKTGSIEVNDKNNEKDIMGLELL